MPRVRPRLRLALLLAGVAVIIAAAVLAPRWLPLRPRTGGSGRVPAPDKLPLDALREAFAHDPTMPLDPQHTDVLVAVICTFRKDRLQPYGQERPTSPFLQLMAEHGVLFEHTIVQSPWTRPSTGALITGRWAEVLQLDDPTNDSFHNRALGADFHTLAEVLGAQGYRTVGASGNPNISSTFGFDQGFDVYQEPESLWRDSHGPAPSGAELNAQLTAGLRATPDDQRIYLQGFYVDTHAPRRPSTKALQIVRGEGQKGSKRVNSYDASLLGLDAHLAQLYAEVKAERPNLLFVVVGDHGEGLNLPEHHGKGHGNHLYTSTVEVPFLWFHPALPQQGARIDGLAMGIDLLPTLLDLLDLSPPGVVDGSSQAAAILGERARAIHAMAFTQTYFRRSDKTAVIGHGYHLIRDRKKDGALSMYRLDEGLQTTDVSGNHPTVVDLLSGELDAWEQEINELAANVGGPVEGEPTREMVEQLRTLGYIE